MLDNIKDTTIEFITSKFLGIIKEIGNDILSENA